MDKNCLQVSAVVRGGSTGSAEPVNFLRRVREPVNFLETNISSSMFHCFGILWVKTAFRTHQLKILTTPLKSVQYLRKQLQGWGDFIFYPKR